MVLGLSNVVAGQDHLTMVSTILTRCIAVVTEQGLEWWYRYMKVDRMAVDTTQSWEISIVATGPHLVAVD